MRISERLRVANALFDDRFGGPQRRVAEVAMGLRGRGVDTVVLLPTGAGNAESVLASNGLHVRRVKMERIPNPHRPVRVLRWSVLLARDIVHFRRVLREEAADVVHVNGAFFLAPAFAARSLGLPVVWHFNDTLVPPCAARLLGGLVRLLATRIVVAAEAVAVHYGVENTPHDVLYAPVDVSRFSISGAAASARSLRRVGILANWNPLKGHPDFLRAIARTVENGVDVRAVLLGARLDTHRAYATDVDRLIAELSLVGRVEERGFVDDVPRALASLDALVLASHSEACPIAVLEGMAAGLPVVATDVGGVRELLTPDARRPAGLVVPPSNPEALSQALTRVLSDQALARRLGRNGRALAAQRFSLERCVAAHEEVYASVVAGRSVP